MGIYNKLNKTSVVCQLGFQFRSQITLKEVVGCGYYIRVDFLVSDYVWFLLKLFINVEDVCIQYVLTEVQKRALASLLQLELHSHYYSYLGFYVWWTYITFVQLLYSLKIIKFLLFQAVIIHKEVILLKSEKLLK